MRTKRSVLNFAAGACVTAVAMVVGVVAAPRLLGWLGEERFGAFRAAQAWWGYVPLLELGLAGALPPLVARALGEGDSAKARRYLAAGLRAYVGVTAAMIAAGLVLSLFIDRLVPVAGPLVSDLRWGFVVGTVAVAVRPLTPLRCATDAGQRTYVIHGLLLLQTLCLTGAALLLARAGFGIVGQFVAVVVGALAYHAALYFDGRRRWPGIFRQAMSGGADREARRDLWRLNGPTLAFEASSAVSLMADAIVVAAVLGASAVVPLFFTQRLAVLVQSQLQAVSASSWAGLAELHAQGMRARFNERLVELTGLVAVFSVAVLVPVAAWNGSFVALWVGPERYGGPWVTSVACLNAFLLAVLTLWGWCFGGTGQVRRLVAPTAVAAVVNVTLSLLLVRPFGIVGPLLGTTAGFLCTSAWRFPLLLREAFGTDLAALGKAVAVPLAWGAPFAAAAAWLAQAHPPRGLFELAAHVAAATACYLVCAWTLVLRRSERAEWGRRVHAILGGQAAA